MWGSLESRDQTVPKQIIQKQVKEWFHEPVSKPLFDSALFHLNSKYLFTDVGGWGWNCEETVEHISLLTYLLENIVY